jgi:hypothetical protein
MNTNPDRSIRIFELETAHSPSTDIFFKMLFSDILKDGEWPSGGCKILLDLFLF